MGKVLPKYLSEWTTEKVKAEGVHVKPNSVVQSANVVDDKVVLQLENGDQVLASTITRHAINTL